MTGVKNITLTEGKEKPKIAQVKGVHSEPPQNVSHWPIDNFEPKAFTAPNTQEELLPPSGPLRT